MANHSTGVREFGSWMAPNMPSAMLLGRLNRRAKLPHWSPPCLACPGNECLGPSDMSPENLASGHIFDIPPCSGSKRCGHVVRSTTYFVESSGYKSRDGLHLSVGLWAGAARRDSFGNDRSTLPFITLIGPAGPPLLLPVLPADITDSCFLQRMAIPYLHYWQAITHGDLGKSLPPLLIRAAALLFEYEGLTDDGVSGFIAFCIQPPRFSDPGVRPWFHQSRGHGPPDRCPSRWQDDKAEAERLRRTHAHVSIAYIRNDGVIRLLRWVIRQLCRPSLIEFREKRLGDNPPQDEEYWGRRVIRCNYNVRIDRTQTTPVRLDGQPVRIQRNHHLPIPSRRTLYDAYCPATKRLRSEYIQRTYASSRRIHAAKLPKDMPVLPAETCWLDAKQRLARMEKKKKKTLVFHVVLHAGAENVKTPESMSFPHFPWFSEATRPAFPNGYAPKEARQVVYVIPQSPCFVPIRCTKGRIFAELGIFYALPLLPISWPRRESANDFVETQKAKADDTSPQEKRAAAITYVVVYFRDTHVADSLKATAVGVYVVFTRTGKHVDFPNLLFAPARRSVLVHTARISSLKLELASGGDVLSTPTTYEVVLELHVDSCTSDLALVRAKSSVQALTYNHPLPHSMMLQIRQPFLWAGTEITTSHTVRRKWPGPPQTWESQSQGLAVRLYQIMGAAKPDRFPLTPRLFRRTLFAKRAHAFLHLRRSPAPQVIMNHTVINVPILPMESWSTPTPAQPHSPSVQRTYISRDILHQACFSFSSSPVKRESTYLPTFLEPDENFPRAHTKYDVHITCFIQPVTQPVVTSASPCPAIPPPCGSSGARVSGNVGCDISEPGSFIAATSAGLYLDVQVRASHGYYFNMSQYVYVLNPFVLNPPAPPLAHPPPPLLANLQRPLRIESITLHPTTLGPSSPEWLGSDSNQRSRMVRTHCLSCLVCVKDLSRSSPLPSCPACPCIVSREAYCQSHADYVSLPNRSAGHCKPRQTQPWERFIRQHTNLNQTTPNLMFSTLLRFVLQSEFPRSWLASEKEERRRGGFLEVSKHTCDFCARYHSIRGLQKRTPAPSRLGTGHPPAAVVASKNVVLQGDGHDQLTSFFLAKTMAIHERLPQPDNRAFPPSPVLSIFLSFPMTWSPRLHDFATAPPIGRRLAANNDLPNTPLMAATCRDERKLRGSG
ncbi:hypothetical protein ACRALDRAFT_1094927 [Sodiomyces alcalophilus JCM 7366]|uniref:uncharacterized protein n=1 Tax=Sodiomyces alcalophilus JCM 7366 TaxID=591952 RepID=UPI0039B49F7B